MRQPLYQMNFSCNINGLYWRPALYFDPNSANVHRGIAHREKWQPLCEANLNAGLPFSEIWAQHFFHIIKKFYLSFSSYTGNMSLRSDKFSNISHMKEEQPSPAVRLLSPSPHAFLIFTRNNNDELAGGKITPPIQSTLFAATCTHKCFCILSLLSLSLPFFWASVGLEASLAMKLSTKHLMENWIPWFTETYSILCYF